MLEQAALPFDARLDRRPSLPYSGRTAVSRACSKAAAKAVSAARVTKTAAYLLWLRDHGPASDHDAREHFGWPMSSVNSIRNGINDRARQANQPEPIRAFGSKVGPFGYENTLWEVVDGCRSR